MPKGQKRAESDYEREAINAVKRFRRKYGDAALRSAANIDDWRDFLDSIGVKTGDTEFWDRVLNKTQDTLNLKPKTDMPPKPKKPSELPTLPSSIVEDYGASVTRFNRSGKPYVGYRDNTTGRFTARNKVGG